MVCIALHALFVLRLFLYLVKNEKPNLKAALDFPGLPPAQLH